MAGAHAHTFVNPGGFRFTSGATSRRPAASTSARRRPRSRGFPAGRGKSRRAGAATRTSARSTGSRASSSTGSSSPRFASVARSFTWATTTACDHVPRSCPGTAAAPWLLHMRWTVLVVFAAGCFYTQDSQLSDEFGRCTGPDEDSAVAAPTWFAMSNRSSSRSARAVTSTAGIAPFARRQAEPGRRAARLDPRCRLTSKRMPPWQPDPCCNRYRCDRSLTDARARHAVDAGSRAAAALGDRRRCTAGRAGPPTSLPARRSHAEMAVGVHARPVRGSRRDPLLPARPRPDHPHALHHRLRLPARGAADGAPRDRVRRRWRQGEDPREARRRGRPARVGLLRPGRRARLEQRVRRWLAAGRAAAPVARRDRPRAARRASG